MAPPQGASRCRRRTSTAVTMLTGRRTRRGDLVHAVVRDSLGYDVEAVAVTGGM